MSIPQRTRDYIEELEHRNREYEIRIKELEAELKAWKGAAAAETRRKTA